MKIGIVGNVAAGKTTVAKIFKEFGFEIINADKIGWEVIEEPEIKLKLISAFGPTIVVSGKIDRRRLGEIVFADKKTLAHLNKIVHPRLIKKLKESLRNSGNVVLDCALLDKFGLVDEMDYIILLIASEVERKRRLIESGFSDKEAETRINVQDDANRFLDVADFVIDNNSDFEKLKEECLKIWNEVSNAHNL